MSPAKFAVVREDPRIELRLLQESGARSLLLVASGGCTALSVKAVRPDVEVVAYDFNPAQIAHVVRKNQALAQADRSIFNVENPDSEGLNQCGAFESLFRVLRTAFVQWLAPEAELAAFFSSATQLQRAELFAKWRASPYWPAVFASVFHEPLLHAMFGPDATQHAVPGSYPGYFQEVIGRGLQDREANRNPFLQHILLGCYRAADAPEYLQARHALELELRLGGLPDMLDLARFPLVHLSNILDWCDDATVKLWARHLEVLAPGARLLVRQLNNQRDFATFWGQHFALEEKLSQELTEQDRSLFYNRIQVWQKR